MTANQTCIFTCCSTTYCSAGSSFLYNELTSCLCTASLCASACGDSGDYCNAPPNITTQACDTCFTKYTAKGAACDTTSANSTLNAACANNSDCAAYTACADGCP